VSCTCVVYFSRRKYHFAMLLLSAGRPGSVEFCESKSAGSRIDLLRSIG
jgi:hypothetical protein